MHHKDKMKKETKELALNQLKSIRELVFENRDWIVSGATFSWSLEVSHDREKIIISRW